MAKMANPTIQLTDPWGRVVLDKDALLEFFYKDLEPTGDLYVDESQAVVEYNQWCKIFDKPQLQLETATPLAVSPEEFHGERQSQWLMPEEYATLDIETWLYERCTTVEQITRVQEELELFQEHKMVDVLRLFVYITTTLRAANVLWGVGRGSSVASYCLFLIGIHRIDSIKYQLDIREFLRDSDKQRV